MDPESLRDAADHRGDPARHPVLLLGQLLAQDRPADDRPAGVAEGLGRDLHPRRVDDRERACTRRVARAPATPASARPSARGRPRCRCSRSRRSCARRRCGSPAGGSARRRSARPRRASRARRRAAGRTGAGALRPRAPSPRRPRRGRGCGRPRTIRPPPQPKAIRPSRRRAEVVDHRARVGDALAAGPAERLEQLGDGLGDHHVARGRGERAAQRPEAQQRAAGGEHRRARGDLARARSSRPPSRPPRSASATGEPSWIRTPAVEQAVAQPLGEPGGLHGRGLRVEGGAAEERRGAAGGDRPRRRAARPCRRRRAPRRPRRSAPRTRRSATRSTPAGSRRSVNQASTSCCSHQLADLGRSTPRRRGRPRAPARRRRRRASTAG